MYNPNRESFSRTALGKSVAKHPEFDDGKDAYVYPVWLPTQPEFSATSLAREVQGNARLLVNSVPRRKEQYAQRHCSSAFKSLMQLYPAVYAQSSHAAQDMQTLFSEFGTKKVQRQFDGLVEATYKHAQSARKFDRT